MGGACGSPRGFLLFLSVWWLAFVVSAQSVVAPPSSQIQRFIGESQAPLRFLEVRTFYTADTNVRPLLRQTLRTEFSAERGYLTGASAYEARLRWECWELCYAYGLADLFEGDSGAARLLLEAEQNRLRPDTSYTVNASLNRSAVHRWTLAYHGESHAASRHLQYQVRLSYLHLQRVQLGWLQGQKRGDSFTGSFTLLTTRGVPAPQIGGYGYALGAGASLEVGDWTVSAHIDNLWSMLSVRTIQRIEATVQMNQLTPDADGFLRAPPLLEGRVSETAMRRTLRPRTELTLWRRESSRRYGLLAMQDEQWRVALIGGWEISGGTLWTAYWQPRPMLWLGYTHRNWSITLGADSLNTGALRRFSGEVSWRLPL
ncbi:MAG: hypothetical protein KatS3mg020_1192 [Fimbriimonadales bacterium]|nr:MAG: hypothetical protein KatS3mg020_1192 [Fimbriimonadales bacterium]